MFVTMFKNWWTTVTGFVIGVAYYLQGAGATMPTNKQEWIHFLIGALFAGLGIVSKDATTGSKPS